MADNPVAYWHFDETNGSMTALDAAGSFDGTYLYSFGGTSGSTFPYYTSTNDLTFGYPSGVPDNSIDTGIHVTNMRVVTIPYALELNPVSGPGRTNSGSSPLRLIPQLPYADFFRGESEFTGTISADGISTSIRVPTFGPGISTMAAPMAALRASLLTTRSWLGSGITWCSRTMAPT